MIDSCLFCQKLTWKKSELCGPCEKWLCEKEPIYRDQSDLQVMSLLNYQDRLVEIIKLCKGGRNQSLSEKFGKVMAESFIKKSTAQVGCVIPIPSSKGIACDHAFLLGLAVAERLQVPLRHDILVADETTTDQKEKSISERLQKSFRLQKQPHFEPGTVCLLVDDVITTGSTLWAAHKMLQAPRALCLTLASRPFGLVQRQTS